MEGTHVQDEEIVTRSANDAATALAEHLAGDEGTFVARMNAKGAELGLTGTRFANPHGAAASTAAEQRPGPGAADGSTAG
ncbi:MAG: hypothetical protein HC770_03075, partial [Pseudanabaena sp. CRU_2_10]|nr:hypothetical protein [Pseudanabaena sp. CRU_2_10]